MKWEILIVAVLFSTATNASDGIQIGDQLQPKVVYTQYGEPCEANCQEVWRFNGMGQILVERGTDGKMVQAWALRGLDREMFSPSDPLTKGAKINRPESQLGTVISTNASDECKKSCWFTVEFHSIGSLIFVLDEKGKIDVASPVPFADLVPMTPPSPSAIVNNQDGGYTRVCPATGEKTSCTETRFTSRSNAESITESVTVIIIYNSSGFIVWTEIRVNGKIVYADGSLAMY